MLQKTRFLVSSIAVLILAGAIAPTAANAGSVGNLMHPYFAARATKDATVAIKLYNQGVISQDVKVNDKVYTVKPHASVTIKAPAGTQVYAATASANHQPGDVLFAITPQLDGETLSFN
jgi:hypothetical protein